MAKKRRDSKRDPSTAKRVLKAGGAVLAFSAGKALFTRTGGLEKASRLIPALSDTKKIFEKELLTKKKTAMNIYSAYDKAIGRKGEAFKKTLRNREAIVKNGKKILKNYKPSTAKTTNALGTLKNIKQISNNELIKEIQSLNLAHAVKGAKEGLLKRDNEKFIRKYGKEQAEKIINQVVDETSAKYLEVSDKHGNVSTEFLKRTAKKLGIDDPEDLREMVSVAAGTLRQETDSKHRNALIKQFKPFLKEVEEKLHKDFRTQRTRDNKLINKIGRKFGIKNLDDLVYGSHEATVEEVLNNLEQLGIDPNDLTDFDDNIKNILRTKGREYEGKINSLNDLMKLNAHGEYDNVIFDKNLRVRQTKDGLEFFDLTELNEIIDNAGNKFDSTIVGRVLTKGIDRKGMRNAPKAHMLKPGFKSVSSSYDKAEDGILKEAKEIINNKLYRIEYDEINKVYHLGEEPIAEGHTINMLHGTFSGVIKSLLGTNREDPMASSHLLMQLLDLGQSGRPNIFERINQWVHKFDNPDWERNIIARVNNFVLNNKDNNEELAKYMQDNNLDEITAKIHILAEELGITPTDAKARLYEDFQVINNMYKNRASSTVLDDEAVAKMFYTFESLVEGGFVQQYLDSADAFVKAHELLNLALSKDRPEDILDELLRLQNNGIVTYQSEGLKRILDQYQTNAAAALEMISIESRSTKKIPIISMEIPETNVEKISGIVRQEIIKEVTSEQDLAAIAVNYAGFDELELEAFEFLNQWQRWQAATSSSGADDLFTSLFTSGGKVDQYVQSTLGDNATAWSVHTIMRDFQTDYGFFSKGTFNGLNESYAPQYNTFEFIPKTKISLELIAGENKWTRFKAAMKEFNAGRNDLANVSPATLVTQYMINRLSMGVEEAGLALSYKSTASPLDTIKNLMLKRVAPAMAAFTAFDYLNDLSQDVTGTGITGAMANTAANMDILGRGIAYKTGIGQALDWFKRTSVMAEYWTGSTDFQTADERKEWYRDGYTPVRKSRFWGFGSSSEFRGGDITFFQPNYLRRIHSDYKDKVLYGSNSEKWAHSIIPTPTHPLSTIRYLMDPYWLERKHIDDAPTPLTGKMFSEGSFWGAILNPTVGEVIKPQIMLPEIKKRMTGKGHDAKGIVRRLNERIKRKRSEYDDMLIVQGTDIRNATYVPYANATPGTITVTGGELRGMDYMEHVQDLNKYRTPDGSTYTQKGPQGIVTRRTEDEGIIRNTVDDFIMEFSQYTGASQDTIRNINDAIKNGAKKGRGRGRQGGPNYGSEMPDSTKGTYIYNNLINEYNTYAENYYSNMMDPSMVNKNKYGDYLRDAKHSAKNLSGIYGFLGEQLFGEDSFTFRYENAGSYSSFSRGFWDMGIGGLGGGTMEIARRFFPSSDKSRVDYNPLVNNMPEWLPDKFHYGVPWTKITKGEMRLPGKGYEALNELHPDEFADENGYGSFDKFKILADVAPNSNEYKIWHNIVRQNIKDPELLAEVKEIESRTKRMAGSHEFYDYQYLHTNTEYNKGVVKEIGKDGTITLANNQILTLAGIEFNENYGGEINNFIKLGQKITYRTEKAIENDPTGKGVIRRAAVYVGNENINKKLMDMGVAERDMSDISAIGNLATVSTTQETWGAVQEIIAHARIPIFHNKLMHVETPLESFVSEQVQGANFQTWDHPIESFVKPMLNEVADQSVIRRLLARSYREFHYSKVLTKNNVGFLNRATKLGSGAVLATLDPAAMLGGTLGFLARLNNGRNGDGRQKYGAFSKGALIGSTLGDIYWAWSEADNPLSGAIAFGALSADIYRKFEVGEFAEKVLKKTIKMKGAVAIGAGIGLGVSAIKNGDFNKDRLFKKHMPKKYLEINEMNEYFDRLEYIKYKGLYEEAARKAALFEGATVKDIFKEIDKNKKKVAKLKKKAEKLLKKYDEGDSEYKNQMAEINRKINSLQETSSYVFKGGKYTKSAVAYKKAMESTIYGLKEGATKDEILAAIPDQYKDYFQRFIDVRDKSEQKKILKYMPDYLKRPLQLAWGMKMEDVQSNRKYFKSHKLPGVGWRGWKPNINLRHVKMKTVQNEGMILSDFGFYESEKGKAAYEIAPDINNYDKPNKFSMFNSIRLASEMKGLGLGLTNVSIDKTSAPGMWVSADIKQSISDRTELATNSMANALQGLAANFF